MDHHRYKGQTCTCRYHTEAAAAKVLVGMKDTSYVPASYIGGGGYRGVDSLMGRPSHISQGFDGPLKYDPDMSMLNTSQGGPDPSTTLAAWRVFYKANASLGHTSAGGQTLGTSFLPPSSNPQYPGAYGASLTPSLTHSTDYSKPDSGSTQQQPQTAPSSSKMAPRLPHITVTNPDLVGTDRPSAARRKAEAASGAAELWDPNKEIATLAGQLAAKAAGDKLVLLEAIGQGGFGTVYRGKWRGLEVAVKTVLFTDHAKDSKVRGQRGAPQQRAILEAATDWKLYLVQEYCSASLQDALSNRLLHNPTTLKPDMDLVLSILMDIARGMDYIHCNNIIHGDLTPGNVLLKQAAESPIGVVSKITDFGLCTTIEAGQSHISNITNGTPFYVAPEVVNSGQLTKTSDVYSFGVLMWELYRCMPPWVKTDTGYVGNKRFRRFPIDTPRPYVALCAQCLERSSKARPTFTQALDMLTAMHTAYLAGYDGLELPQQSPSKPQLPVLIPTLSPPSTSTSPATNSPPPLPPNHKPSQTAIQPKEEGGAGPGGKPAAITPGTPTASTAQSAAAAAATGLHLVASPSQGGGHGSGAAAGTVAQAVVAGTSMVVATHDGVLKINSQPRSQAFVRLFASGLGSSPAATSGALGGLGVPHSAYKRQSAADLAKATADAWAARELVVAAVTEPDKTEGGMSGVPEGYVEARKLVTLTPHAHAVTPPCPYFGPCGGCTLQSLDYSQQLLEKQNQVVQVLQRVGRLQGVQALLLPPLGATM
ncbi:protein kinase domain-containing protein [Haematococcus lacustris]|uniref:Protein kinase domain-containing protein n=1 Tax=Haematococcus lacustris TaxID=44745 RepID=A0A699YEH0_HAELA|nr:protein kinase domain-containing protein [Haematococcus lacustris]